MKFCKRLLVTIILLVLIINSISKTYKKSHRHHTHRKNHHKSSSKLNILPVVAHALAYEDEGHDIKSFFPISKKFAGVKNDIIGFIGHTIIEGRSIVVVFIRGTKSLGNLMTDIKYSTENIGKGMGACPECKIHGGFWKAYKNLKIPLFESFESVMEQLNNVDHVIFTGHSLGGAMSNLAVYTYFNRRNFYSQTDHLKDTGAKYYSTKDVSLITFGAPRVGNKIFANFLNNLVSSGKLNRNYRVVYNKDPIASLPPKKIKDNIMWGNELDFEHAGTEIKYNEVKFDTLKGKNEKARHDELHRLFDIEPSSMGTDLSDDSNNIGTMQVLWSFSDISDHSFYKYLNGEKLWKFILAQEAKKKH